MSDIKYGYSLLEKFCREVFLAFGFSDTDSKIITDVLLLSDLYGIESHGLQRMVRYHKGIEKGLIKVNAPWNVVHETPMSAVVDANEGMGQVVGHMAMEKAIEKAKKIGMAIVTVRNSNHYGIAGYYAKMACDAGLIGLSMTNSEAIMVPTFGRIAMLGSNPIALAVPATPVNFLLDASTTVVTRGKLEVYNKRDEVLPDGWALNEKGHDTTDAARVLKNIVEKKGGGIMPLGGSSEKLGSHKGYGYGMIAEIFSSILSLGMTSNRTHIGGKGGTCHGFIAINPSVFGDAEEIKQNFSTFLQELRDSDKAEGAPRIYTHGEKEVEAYADRIISGIAIDKKTLIEMKELSDYLKLDFESYFGKADIDGVEKDSSYN